MAGKQLPVSSFGRILVPSLLHGERVLVDIDDCQPRDGSVED